MDRRVQTTGPSLVLGRNQFFLLAALFLEPERTFPTRGVWVGVASERCLQLMPKAANAYWGAAKAQPSVLRRALVVTKAQGSARPVWLSLRGAALCEGRIPGLVRLDRRKPPIAMTAALASLVSADALQAE